MVWSSPWCILMFVFLFGSRNFRKFPFDSQTLVMQFTSGGITEFIPSASSTRWLIRGEGDIVSGWNVSDVEIVPKSANVQDELDYFIGNFGIGSAPGDPAPVTGGNEAFKEAEFIGFDVQIQVERFGRYYSLNMIAPLLLLVALSFITYIIPAQNFDARIALVRIVSPIHASVHRFFFR